MSYNYEINNENSIKNIKNNNSELFIQEKENKSSQLTNEVVAHGRNFQRYNNKKKIWINVPENFFSKYFGIGKFTDKERQRDCVIKSLQEYGGEFDIFCQLKNCTQEFKEKFKELKDIKELEVKEKYDFCSDIILNIVKFEKRTEKIEKLKKRSEAIKKDGDYLLKEDLEYFNFEYKKLKFLTPNHEYFKESYNSYKKVLLKFEDLIQKTKDKKHSIME
jgi:hypothetical protein